MHLAKRMPSPDATYWGANSKGRCSPTGVSRKTCRCPVIALNLRSSHSQCETALMRSYQKMPFLADSAANSEGSGSHRKAKNLTQQSHPETICRPTPIRAVESEPDLLRLAHSLMSLNPSRRLSPSDTSAFRSAEPIKQMAS